MTPRQAYVAKRLGVLLLIGLAIAGYVHGIYWAGGINQPGNNWSHRDMPWQAALIDLAPIWVLVVGTLGTMFALIGHDICDALGVTIISDYRSLPKAPTKAQKLAAKQAEREATIARLEQELGLVPQPPRASCAHHYRHWAGTVGGPAREVCDHCGVVVDNPWRVRT